MSTCGNLTAGRESIHDRDRLLSVGDFPRARFVAMTSAGRMIEMGSRSPLPGAEGLDQRSRLDIDNGSRQLAWFYFTNDDIDYAIASVFTGTLRRFVPGSGEVRNNRNNFVGLYVQDNFRVTRRWSLNLGLRWDPFSLERDPGSDPGFRPEGLRCGKEVAIFHQFSSGLVVSRVRRPGTRTWNYL